MDVYFLKGCVELRMGFGEMALCCGAVMANAVVELLSAHCNVRHESRHCRRHSMDIDESRKKVHERKSVRAIKGGTGTSMSDITSVSLHYISTYVARAEVR
jgi:hypothetical protein